MDTVRKLDARRQSGARERRQAFGMAFALVLYALAPLSMSAQNFDPILGTWTLDLSKSTFAAGRAPRQQTLVYSMVGRLVKTVSDGIDSQGNPTHVEFTVVYDGAPHPIVGMSAADASTYTRIDANSAEFTRTLNGKVVLTGRRELSNDGATLTITTTSIEADGSKGTSVAVYVREQ